MTTAKEKPAAAAKSPPAAAAPAPAATAPAKPGSGEAVTLSADLSKGFARILFQWPRPVTFDADIADGILIVTFARPFRLPPDMTSLPLSAYVSVIKQDANQRTLRLSLKQKVRLHTSAGGPLVAIDLLPAAFAGEPDGVVDPTAKPPPPPQGVVPVKLSIGVEEDRTRIAFDWGEVVKYEAKIEPGKIKVAFARQGKIDVSRLNDGPPAFVKSAKVSAGDNQTLLEIAIDPGSAVKDFRNKTRIVFDIAAPANDKDGDPQIALPEGLEPKAKPDDIAAAGDHETPPPEGSAAHPPGSDGAAVEGTHGAGEAEHKAGEKSAETESGEAGANPHEPPPDAAPHEPKPETADAGNDTAHDADPQDAKPDAAEPHDAESHAAEAAPPAEPPAFKAARDHGNIVLTLPALDGTGAAVFKRGDTAFVVLDGARAIDAAALVAQFRDAIASASTTTVDGATVLTIKLLKPLALSAGQVQHGWTATFSVDPLAPARPVALIRDARSVGPARIRASLARAGKVVSLTDPASGERLVAVLASGEPQGVAAARSYVEFAADPTAQGLLVRPFSDDLTVVPEDDDVLIGAPGGLTLSAATASDTVLTRSTISDGFAPAAMDFAAWAGPGDFPAERSRLVDAIPEDGEDIEAARLALARFYLGNDLGAEALGSLQLVVADDEAVTGDPAFHALRGAALLLLGRYQAAADELATPALDGDVHAQLFRGLAAAGLRRWSEARDAMARGEEAIASFRPDWQGRFRVAGARAAAETNAMAAADAMLAAMPRDGVPEPILLEADLIRGQLAEKLKRDTEALRLYAKVKNTGYRPLAIRAALAEIALEERTGTLKRDDAIDALDHLRWQWRGDDVELAILHRLGKLQVAKGDYRAGLQTMRSAVLGFPQAEETRAISADMGQLFEELFLNGKADSLPPIQALGLYYDFKELTPIGTLGDEMVRKLADRLISVDLLEQAAELLQHQVDKRLDGVARAQIAAKLAAVYLMDRKPEKALAALRTSAQTRLPDNVAAPRRLLAGRALSDLKQYDAALEAFEQDDTPEARRLRADVQWAGSRWAEAAAAVEVLLEGRETAQRPLDGGERYDVMRAAVAYTMAGNEPGLAKLRDRFLTLMAEAPEAAAFEMVTRSVDPSGVAFRDMAKAVAATDTLDAFLQSLGLGKPAGGSASAN
ncbi:MAG: hypothetical protein IT548_09940 [Alphaproteobacteria bacterium]|nr:hypothetical protein [Alphaproteobacteria bacterium]